MEDKRFCEFSIEGVYECTKEEEEEILKKIQEAIEKLAEGKELVRIDSSVSKYSAADIALAIARQKDDEYN
jgi:hypothetical protein